MSYEEALEAAGAKIIAFEAFGSYQGEWIAKVGEDKYVTGSYGSCSGCDAFEAEFDWDDEEKDDYKERLAAFGKSYLDSYSTKEELLKLFKEQAEWDSDAESIIIWLERN